MRANGIKIELGDFPGILFITHYAIELTKFSEHF